MISAVPRLGEAELLEDPLPPQSISVCVGVCVAPDEPAVCEPGSSSGWGVFTMQLRMEFAAAAGSSSLQ